LELLNDWFKDSPDKVLNKLYADNLPWMEQYVLQNSGSGTDAHDLFQEAITAAWVNLHTGRFSGSREQFNAYLRQIAKHKWLNELRTRSRKKTTVTDQLPEQEAPILHLAENENTEQSTLLRQSFQELGDKCRTILGLYYYRKKSLNEIALELNNTENSIKTIKYRCMMQLRQLFLEKSRQHGGL
jgi:RNA polymerase sigma factor (sigma-70 family)